jgi:hypothetical protein
MIPLFRLANDPGDATTLPGMLTSPAEIAKPPLRILLVGRGTDGLLRQT